MKELLEQSIRQMAERAFIEDCACDDVTSRACIDPAAMGSAHIVLKQPARIAGLAFLPHLFQTFDPDLSLSLKFEEGEDANAGTILAIVKGRLQSLLASERTALNLLQHTCGVATLTAQFVEQVKGYACDILDTRKTIPGMRRLQKYAVRMGGGKNHRFDLKEKVLIKNNHLKVLRKRCAEPIAWATRRAKEQFPDVPVEVEVENIAMLQEALLAGVEWVMLDNMSVSAVREAVELAQGRAYLEASGGMTLANIRAYAATHVNGISIGALTHSAPAVDISMRLCDGP